MMKIGTGPGTGLDAGGDDDFQSFSFLPVCHLSFPFSIFLFDETTLDNETGNTTITNMHALS